MEAQDVEKPPKTDILIVDTRGGQREQPTWEKWVQHVAEQNPETIIATPGYWYPAKLIADQTLKKWASTTWLAKQLITPNTVGEAKIAITTYIREAYVKHGKGNTVILCENPETIREILKITHQANPITPPKAWGHPTIPSIVRLYWKTQPKWVIAYHPVKKKAIQYASAIARHIPKPERVKPIWEKHKTIVEV